MGVRADLAVLGTDGTVGGPGGSPVTLSGVAVGGALKPPSGSTRTSTLGSPVLRDVISINDFGADRTGSSDSTTALRDAIAETQAILASGYANEIGAAIYVPAGRYQLTGKISVPNCVLIYGDGHRSTSFFLGGSTFPDNCVFEPLAIDWSQECMFLRGFSLYGPGGTTPTMNQPNAGAASTVQAGVAVASMTTSFPLVATSDISAYASNGTLAVGSKRVIYQSITTATKTFNNCYVISGLGAAINAGDAISAVTTDNVRGIHVLGMATPTHLRDLLISTTTGENILVGQCNAVDIQQVTANYSNRDNILHTGIRPGVWYRNVLGEYAGVSDVGGTFAGLHIQGQSAGAQFQGFHTVDNFYSEQTSHNAIGIWLDNIGSVTVNNANLEGGVNSGGTSWATHTCVKITSTQSSPTTQDGEHTANISLRNIGSQEPGRVTLNDTVRGFATPANTGSSGSPGVAITRYDTEDFGSAASRADVVRRGTLSALRQSYDFKIPASSLSSLTSGTEYATGLELLQGESYDHVAFWAASTAATFGTNSDGHWFFTIRDSGGNLVAHTADQGTTAIGASAALHVALASTFSPPADGFYYATFMIYLGTGGTPVMPTMKCAANVITGGSLISGIPSQTASGNAGSTTGTPASTLTIGGNLTSIPWAAVYHT